MLKQIKIKYMITINENGSHQINFKTRPKELKNPYYISDPELFKIYQKSLPPPEAYFYFPKGTEIIITNEEKPEKSLRRIFNNVQISDFEKKLLKEYKDLIYSHPENKLPEYWDDSFNLRFIHATECNLKKSYERMIKYINWFHNIFPMEIHPNDKIYQLLNLGFLYIYGRDKHFRPIIICQPSICQKYIHLFKEKEIIDASVFLFQFIVNNMLLPGQIENWVMILNFEGSSPLNMPDIVKKLIKIVSENFLSRLYKCYIYGMSFLINLLFKIVCNFLEEVTVQKITILDKKNINTLFENIRKDNVEEKFGGTAPNIQGGIENSKSSLFPPRMPSNNYILENENKDEILITKEKYLQLVEEKKIREEFISPYLKEEIEKIKQQKQFESLSNQFCLNQWKFQNEFEGTNKIRNINKNCNILKDLNSFNSMKNSFHKSINIINGNK